MIQQSVKYNDALHLFGVLQIPAEEDLDHGFRMQHICGCC